jgi:hypothetical protein
MLTKFTKSSQTSTIRTARPPTVLSVDKVRELGKARGRRYIEHKGSEYQVGGELPFRDKEALAGSTVLAEPEIVTDGGQQLTIGSTYRLLHEVPKGTAAAAMAVVEKRRAPAQLRPADALDGCALLRGRPGLIVPSGGMPAPKINLKPTGYAPSKGRTRGRDILVRIRHKGVEFRGDPPVPWAPSGRLPYDVAELFAVPGALRLVRGLLANDAPCELPHKEKVKPEAVTVLVGDVLACEGHRLGGGA